MRPAIDLHMHSLYSEGKLTCRELVQRAVKNNIKVMALTDHNVLYGSDEMIREARAAGIEAMSGVEIYTRHGDQQLHLLGYHVDTGKTRLSQTLRDLQKENKERVEKSIRELIDQGFIIDVDAIFSLPSHNRGVVHILEEIDRHPENINKMKKELPPDQQDFFSKVTHYMGHDAPAALRVSEISTTQAIQLVHEAGGFASLAHPGQQLRYDKDALIHDLKKEGLDALEVLSPYHTWHQIEHYQVFALDNDLAMTGGTDYHGDIAFTGQELVHRQWDYFSVPYRFFERLNKQFNLL